MAKPSKVHGIGIYDSDTPVHKTIRVDGRQVVAEKCPVYKKWISMLHSMPIGYEITDERIVFFSKFKDYITKLDKDHASKRLVSTARFFGKTTASMDDFALLSQKVARRVLAPVTRKDCGCPHFTAMVGPSIYISVTSVDGQVRYKFPENDSVLAHHKGIDHYIEGLDHLIDSENKPAMEFLSRFKEELRFHQLNGTVWSPIDGLMTVAHKELYG